MRKQRLTPHFGVEGSPNFKNRTLFQGDNLAFLRAMNSGSVQLVATDPPFKKGRDFHATPDSLAEGASFQDRWSWKEDVHPEWVDQITDDWPHVMEVIQGSRASYGDDMGAFLCFMAVRLLEMWRILREDGSLYLHCDPTSSHYLKELMDAIFGHQNFRNEIAWCYKGPGNATMHFPRKHDLILFYSKSEKTRFNADAIRVPYSDSFLQRRRYSEGEKGITARYSQGRSETCVREQFAGKIPEDWWADIPSGGQISKNERTGFPTQKPLALYERIVKASSSLNDFVLDPFAGCATTLVAAEKLGRQWVGMDLWNQTGKVVSKRMEKISDETSTLLKAGRIPKIHCRKRAYKRTDDGQNAVPFLVPVEQRIKAQEPPGPKMPRAEMLNSLLEKHGWKCQGCDREFDDARYLELDHNTPRSDGGLNHISNRVLLCGPCNKAKSNEYTLSGLRKINKKNGWMVVPLRSGGKTQSR